MSFEVPPLPAALPPPPGGRVPGPDRGPGQPAFAKVLELETARAKRDARVAGEIPKDVWMEVEAANKLFEELQAEGQQIVFDDGRLHGRLVISLCDLQGRVLRAVTPTEIVGTPPPPADSAQLEGGAA